jgi:hypothetical protein
MAIDYDTRVSVSPQPPQDGRWAIFVPASYKNMTLGEAQLTATLALALGLLPPLGYCPLHCPPPLRGALTPVPLVQRGYHLPLPLAGYQSLCVSSQLSASALCSN